MRWAGSFSPGGGRASPGTKALGSEAACRAGAGLRPGRAVAASASVGPRGTAGVDVQLAPGAPAPRGRSRLCDEPCLCESQPAGPGELRAEASPPGPPQGFRDGHQGRLWATERVHIHLEEEFQFSSVQSLSRV